MLIEVYLLCTINGPCAWHQAIAGPFNNKNLNAKLICDFGIPRFIFYAVSAGPRVKITTVVLLKGDSPVLFKGESSYVTLNAIFHSFTVAPYKT